MKCSVLDVRHVLTLMPEISDIVVYWAKTVKRQACTYNLPLRSVHATNVDVGKQ